MRETNASTNLEDEGASENSDVIDHSEDLSDGFSLDGSVASSEGDWDSEEEILGMSTCTCGTLSQAHKTDCPMSSRNRYPSCTLFPKVSSDESCADDESDDSTLPKDNEHLAGSTQLGKRDRLAIDETPSAKKSKPDSPSFKVGDHVCVHTGKLDKHHIPCRVVQVVNNVCRLYSCKEVLKRGFCSSELKALSSDWSISLENWRTAARVSLGKVSGDSECLEVCKCSLPKPARTVVNLTEDSQDVSSGAGSPAGGNWLHNALYSLTLVNREEVLSPTGWLSDSVIAAAQLIILQEFPYLSGLQNPVLQQNVFSSAQRTICADHPRSKQSLVYCIQCRMR